MTRARSRGFLRLRISLQTAYIVAAWNIFALFFPLGGCPLGVNSNGRVLEKVYNTHTHARTHRTYRSRSQSNCIRYVRTHPQPPTRSHYLPTLHTSNLCLSILHFFIPKYTHTLAQTIRSPLLKAMSCLCNRDLLLLYIYFLIYHNSQHHHIFLINSNLRLYFRSWHFSSKNM